MPELAEGARLEIVCAFVAYLGFESLFLRHSFPVFPPSYVKQRIFLIHVFKYAHIENHLFSLLDKTTVLENLLREIKASHCLRCYAALSGVV